MILYVAQKKCIKVMNVTILHSYGWWKKAATTTALTIGSKLLEQAFGTGDHKPKLVPGQIQPQPSKNVMQDTKIWKHRYTKKLTQILTTSFILLLSKHNHRHQASRAAFDPFVAALPLFLTCHPPIHPNKAFTIKPYYQSKVTCVT